MLRQASKLLLLLFLCTSCDYFSPDSSTSNSNLQVLNTMIDYTSVDVYPIFADCENYAENDNQKQCFETSITEKLASFLKQNEFKVDKAINDSASIDILIDNTGKATLVGVNSSPLIKQELPDLERILRESINRLPTMKPALKRGMFVKSQYRLVLVVETI